MRSIGHGHNPVSLCGQQNAMLNNHSGTHAEAVLCMHAGPTPPPTNTGELYTLPKHSLLGLAGYVCCFTKMQSDMQSHYCYELALLDHNGMSA